MNNREDIEVSQLLAAALAFIRMGQYVSATAPLLKLREFVILHPLQVTEGEKLALNNLEDSVSAALIRASEARGNRLGKSSSTKVNKVGVGL